MRSFEERKAEIFRRSEVKMQERKRTRNSIFAVCVPVLFCVTLCCTVILPTVMPESKSETDKAEQYAANGMLCLYVTAEIRDLHEENGFYQKWEDETIIADIANTIQSVYSECCETVPENMEIPETVPADEQTEIGKLSGYLITLTDSDGGQAVYMLVGHSLINNATQQAHTLTDDQLHELKAVLGLLQK